MSAIHEATLRGSHPSELPAMIIRQTCVLTTASSLLLPDNGRVARYCRSWQKSNTGSTFLFHRWPGLFHSSTAVEAPSHRDGQPFLSFTALVGAIMSKPQEAPYGTWKSPLPADAFAAGAVSLEEVVVNVSADRFRLQGAVQLIENDSNRTARSTSLR
jgi:hypothetical protein